MTEIIGIDHIYIAVTDLGKSEAFYDGAMAALGFRKNTFTLGDDRHVHYYNRYFGYVLRPARGGRHDAYAPGLHHLCFRVETAGDVKRATQELQALGINASEAKNFPEYAPDYWASFFTDPDGLRLEITNYRQERKDRHDHW